MRFSAAELWDEWSSYPQGDEATDTAELSGLVAALPLKKDENEETAVLRSSRLWALRRLTRLWKNSRWREEWNIAGSLFVPPNMKGRVELVLPRDLYDRVAAVRQANWAWVRGVLGGCGALYVPKSGYYLVLRVGAEPVAKYLARMLRRTRNSWSQRTMHTRREFILRDQQGIVAFLNKIGLTNVSLDVEDKAILRSIRDQANRMRNCDTANIRKTLEAAREQTELALTLSRENVLPALPAAFRTLVELRLEHPEESLSDLGRRLSPPVTKSTVKYRWKRLCEWVNKINSDET